MVPVLVFLNNYLHDLATAFFFTLTLVAWWGRKRLPEAHPEILPRLRRAALLAFVLILLLGAVRTYYYKTYEWLPALGRGQVAVLMVKHVFLFGLTAWAGWAWWRMKRA